MWAEANEDQCRWWLGTTTCTQIAVDAVTPFNCHPPLVREELLLAPHHPSFVPSLISYLFPLSFSLLFFSLSFLSAVWPVGWICSPLCVCVLRMAITELMFSQIVIHMLFVCFCFFYVCHGSLCLVLSCLLLSCLSFSLTVTLYHLSLSLMNIRHNRTLQTDLVWHGSGSPPPPQAS